MQVRILTEPTRFSGFIDKGHADRNVRSLVRKFGDGFPCLVGNPNPFLLELDRVKFFGLEFREIKWIDPCKSHDHLEKRHRVESWVFSDGCPEYSFQRIFPAQG